MGEITLKLIFDILRELVPGEISEASLQHLLLLTQDTVKNIWRDEGTKWPNEKSWGDNARKKIEEEYMGLTSKALENKFVKSSIHVLRNCCYGYDANTPFYINFEERLLYLVQTVFVIAPKNRYDPNQIVAEMLQKNEVPQEDVDAFEALDGDPVEIAKFLVSHAKSSRGKRRTTQKKAKKVERPHAESQSKAILNDAEPILDSESFTNTTVPRKSDKKIIHREKELAELEQLLTEEPGAAILLSGTGGIGKTTLARVLYGKLSKNFEQVGWVNYRKDLKSSLLNCMNYARAEQDEEKRWHLLHDWLRNTRAKTLLIIDNVDVDARQNQDPATDNILVDASSWANVTVLVTSRLETLQGYDEYPVGVLGGEEDCRECCADLFCSFYPGCITGDPGQRVIIDRLVARAGYHTYAIELLAKSAKHEDLEKYLKKIESAGFQFPQIKVSTDHSFNIDPAPANAAEQLRRLFNLHTRSEKEQQILLDFSVLPELISLSPQELKDWLGYTSYDDDLNRLESEGWITFDGGFSIHPLVRETMQLDFVDGKAPEGTAAKLFGLLESGNFCLKWEKRTIALNKVQVAESILKHTVFPNYCTMANIFFHMGEMKTIARRELYAEAFYSSALNLYRKLEEADPGVYQYSIARTCNRIARRRIIEPERNQYLRESIDICIRHLAKDVDDVEKYEEELGRACFLAPSWVPSEILIRSSIFPENTVLEKRIKLLEPVRLMWENHRAGSVLPWQKTSIEILESVCQTWEKYTVENFLAYGAEMAEFYWLLSVEYLETDYKEANGSKGKEWYRLSHASLAVYLELEDKVPGVYRLELGKTQQKLAGRLETFEEYKEEAERLYFEAVDTYIHLIDDYDSFSSIISNLADICYKLEDLISPDIERIDEVLQIYYRVWYAFLDIARKGSSAFWLEEHTFLKFCLRSGDLLIVHKNPYFSAEEVYKQGQAIMEMSYHFHVDLATEWVLSELAKGKTLPSYYTDFISKNERLRESGESHIIPSLVRSGPGILLSRLGELISRDKDRREEVERVYRKALRWLNPARMENGDAEEIFNVYRKLGKILETDSNRKTEAVTLYHEALTTFQRCEAENPGQYMYYLTQLNDYLAALTDEYSEEKTVIQK